MLDFVVRNARLHDAPQTVDIAVRNGAIVDIATPITGEAAASFDANGRLLTRGFVESHIHLDKACLLDRCTNRSGTLEGAVMAVSAAKRDFTEADIVARGRRVIEKAILQGTNAMRSHVEVDPQIGLAGLNAVRLLKEQFRWAIDIQICVFPQEGMTNNPGTEELLRQALENGADLLGGCPYTDTHPKEHIERVFKMARNYDMALDFHLDFDLDVNWNHLEEVAKQTTAFGWEGRVAIGHVTKLSAFPPEEFDRLARILGNAGISVAVLPATDLFLMGRGHSHSIPRGVAPAHRLAKAGITCTIATNNVLNPFTPFGDCSLPRMANLFANVAHLGEMPELDHCFAMIAENPTRLLGLPDRIEVGAPATFVLLPVDSRPSAIAEIARPIWGMKDGRVTFENPPGRLFGNATDKPRDNPVSIQ
jgi:cytosine/creatinine deaminase